MASLLHDVCLASLPRRLLPVLAEVRCVSGVFVALEGERAWVRWEPGTDAVLRRLLPVSGSQLHVFRDGHWYPLGRHLPLFAAPPESAFRPLHQVLTPAPVQGVPAALFRQPPALLDLVADGRPRSTTAMECDLAEVSGWADAVPTPRLAAIRAARCGSRLLLLGPQLPLLPSGRRFWGEMLLVPLGYRPEPDLPEQAIREALAVVAGEILVLTAGRVEVISRSVFRPLTRVGIRLAGREGSDE
jgi:hypothetical protein